MSRSILSIIIALFGVSLISCKYSALNDELIVPEQAQLNTVIAGMEEMESIKNSIFNSDSICLNFINLTKAIFEENYTEPEEALAANCMHYFIHSNHIKEYLNFLANTSEEKKQHAAMVFFRLMMTLTRAETNTLIGKFQSDGKSLLDVILSVVYPVIPERITDLLNMYVHFEMNYSFVMIYSFYSLIKKNDEVLCLKTISSGKANLFISTTKSDRIYREDAHTINEFRGRSLLKLMVENIVNPYLREYKVDNPHRVPIVKLAANFPINCFFNLHHYFTSSFSYVPEARGKIIHDAYPATYYLVSADLDIVFFALLYREMQKFEVDEILLGNFIISPLLSERYEFFGNFYGAGESVIMMREVIQRLAPKVRNEVFYIIQRIFKRVTNERGANASIALSFFLSYEDFPGDIDFNIM